MNANAIAYVNEDNELKLLPTADQGYREAKNLWGSNICPLESCFLDLDQYPANQALELELDHSGTVVSLTEFFDL